MRRAISIRRAPRRVDPRQQQQRGDRPRHRRSRSSGTRSAPPRRCSASSGSRAIQNASLLPNPPGTRLARPMTWPRKNALREARRTTAAAGRSQAGDEHGARQQPVGPADAGERHRRARQIPAARLFVAPPDDRLCGRARGRHTEHEREQPPAPPQAAAGPAATPAQPCVQPASPDENAIGDRDRRRRAGPTVGRRPARYSQNRMAGPASGPSVRKLLQAKQTAP